MLWYASRRWVFKLNNRLNQRTHSGPIPYLHVQQPARLGSQKTRDWGLAVLAVQLCVNRNHKNRLHVVLYTGCSTNGARAEQKSKMQIASHEGPWFRKGNYENIKKTKLWPPKKYGNEMVRVSSLQVSRAARCSRSAFSSVLHFPFLSTLVTNWKCMY